MADIKRQDITLSNRTKGISVDEYAWGSYFYAEWIQSNYNTKSFKLWPLVKKKEVNRRPDGYAKNMLPSNELWVVFATYDGRIEWLNHSNWTTTWASDSGEWWPIFSLPWGWVDTNYLNCILWDDKIFWIKQTYADIIDYNYAYDKTADLLSDPTFEDGTWWTIWSWWTIWDWAKHTTWETWTLSTDLTWLTTGDYLRIAIKIVDCAAWSVNVKTSNGANNIDTVEWENGWDILTNRWATWTYTITITPTSDFDGTIECVNVFKYSSSYVKIDKLSISRDNTSELRPAIIWGWDLYIWAWGIINVFSLTDGAYTKSTKNITKTGESIVAITQQAWNLIIWATDGYNSTQYYWNGVDAIATEAIEWKWLVFKAVTWTETVSYAITKAWDEVSVDQVWYEYRLYAVSWYQRNLIANKVFFWGDRDYINSTTYSPLKKFEFNDVENSESLCIFLDSLYIPWCDWLYEYGNDVPWFWVTMTKPISYDTWATHICVSQNGKNLNIWEAINNINYIANVVRWLYTPTGYLITESIYRDKVGTRKAIQNMKIWYKNLNKTVWNIKLYAIVDDNYFWRFRPSTAPTVRPSVWDVYSIANDTKWEAIDVDKVEWVITFRTIEDKGSYPNRANITLTKISWDGDATISVGYDFDNMVHIKTIENDSQWYDSDLIFWKDRVNNYIPFRHKIQFVIELNSDDSLLSPEIYEITMVSDISDTVL